MEPVVFCAQKLLLRDASTEPSALYQLHSRGKGFHLQQPQRSLPVHRLVHDHVRAAGPIRSFHLASILDDLLLEYVTPGISYAGGDHVDADTLKYVP